MWPQLFTVPLPHGQHFTIHSYGLMLVVGFFCALEVAKYLAHRNGLNPEHFSTAALLALFTGIAGARISHVIENWPYFTSADFTWSENLWHMINVNSGGLTYYGGFLLATPTLILYAIAKRVPLRLGMDIIAPCLMIGLGFGRIGCYLNGCCYGAECNLPWAAHFPYGSETYTTQFKDGKIVPPAALMHTVAPGRYELVPADQAAHVAALRHIQIPRANGVHPSQLYSSFTAFLLAAMLISFLTLHPPPGRVFALMCVMEGTARFLLEMLRVEPGVFHTPISLSMWIGAAVALTGVVLWFWWAPKVPAHGFPLDFTSPTA
jgi:phosphatidylglycerol:prolipoprotein diacylglycerol transferase